MERMTEGHTGECSIVLEGGILFDLRLLQEAYREKVDIICIDFPWNAEQKGHMRNSPLTAECISAARVLLSQEGCMFISAGDGEAESLKPLCGKIFGEENVFPLMAFPPGVADREPTGGRSRILACRKNANICAFAGFRQDEKSLAGTAGEQGSAASDGHGLLVRAVRRICGNADCRKMFIMETGRCCTAKQNRTGQAEEERTGTADAIAALVAAAESAKIRQDREMLERIRDDAGRMLKEIREAGDGGGDTDVPVELLGLSVKTTHTVKRGGYRIISDFEGKTREELLKLWQMGPKTLSELETALVAHGILLA